MSNFKAYEPFRRDNDGYPDKMPPPRRDANGMPWLSPPEAQYINDWLAGLTEACKERSRQYHRDKERSMTYEQLVAAASPQQSQPKKTMDLRWSHDDDGSRELQQRVVTNGGSGDHYWVKVPVMER